MLIPLGNSRFLLFCASHSYSLRYSIPSLPHCKHLSLLTQSIYCCFFCVQAPITSHAKAMCLCFCGSSNATNTCSTSQSFTPKKEANDAVGFLPAVFHIVPGSCTSHLALVLGHGLSMFCWYHAGHRDYDCVPELMYVFLKSLIFSITSSICSVFFHQSSLFLPFFLLRLQAFCTTCQAQTFCLRKLAMSCIMHLLA